MVLSILSSVHSNAVKAYVVYFDTICFRAIHYSCWLYVSSMFYFSPLNGAFITNYIDVIISFIPYEYWRQDERR